MGSTEFFVFGLCVLTSGLSAVLLLKTYKKRPDRLLLWSGIYFVLLALNSILVFFDHVLPQYDLTIPRALASLSAVCVLLYAFIWELR